MMYATNTVKRGGHSDALVPPIRICERLPESHFGRMDAKVDFEMAMLRSHFECAGEDLAEW